MIFTKTILKVVDNSGVKVVKCIRIFKTISSFGKSQVAKIGDAVLVSVKFTKSKNIQKGQIYKALIVRTKKENKRLYGYIKFGDNAVILLNKKIEPLGNRIFGPVGLEVILQNFIKISSVRVNVV